MNEHFEYLTEKCTMTDIMILVSENIDLVDSIPVLTDKDSKILLFSV